jgi:hypothetical protein
MRVEESGEENDGITMRKRAKEEEETERRMWEEELGTFKRNRDKNEVDRIIRVEQRMRIRREE